MLFVSPPSPTLPNATKQASYNITDEGIKLLSASTAREFQVTNEGLQTTTSRTGHNTPPSELCYKCSARDVHVFHTLGAGASGVVKKAVHVPSHRFIALKIMTVGGGESTLVHPPPPSSISSTLLHPLHYLLRSRLFSLSAPSSPSGFTATQLRCVVITHVVFTAVGVVGS